MKESTKQLKEALTDKLGVAVLYIKGTFVARDGQRFSIGEARKLTNLKAPERKFNGKVNAYGDWATVVLLNRARI